MERAVVLGLGPHVTPSDLPPRVAGTAAQAQAVSISLAYHAAVAAYKREVLV
jgi:hypothetical protein